MFPSVPSQNTDLLSIHTPYLVPFRVAYRGLVLYHEPKGTRNMVIVIIHPIDKLYFQSTVERLMFSLI